MFYTSHFMLGVSEGDVKLELRYHAVLRRCSAADFGIEWDPVMGRKLTTIIKRDLS
jgi:hypothetical protein